MDAPKTIREKVKAEVAAAMLKAALGTKTFNEHHKPSDFDYQFHGKPSATIVVRGESRTVKFGEEFNRKTDLAVFVSQLVDELVAKDEAAAEASK